MTWVTLPEREQKFIAVHSQLVRQHDPLPLRIHHKGRSIPARMVHINGPSTMIYSGDEPNERAGGARAYLETDSEVLYDVGSNE